MKPPEKPSPARPAADRVAKWSAMASSLAVGGLGAFLFLRLCLHVIQGAEGVYQPFQGMDLPADDWTSWAMGPVLMILGLLGWRMTAALFRESEQD